MSLHSPDAMLSSNSGTRPPPPCATVPAASSRRRAGREAELRPGGDAAYARLLASGRKRLAYRNPIHCIVPPVVLERIAERGDEEQRRWALGTISRDQSLRTLRAQLDVARGAAPRSIRAAGAGPEPAPQRTIYDAENTDTLGGEVARAEGAPATGDEAVDEAYDGLGATHRCLWEVFERDSLDDDGLPLQAVVHFGKNYGNAFWNGQLMVFGDGDGSIFARFTRSLDVIAHELGHGVVGDEAGLYYWQQPGALNESMADVLGVLVKQYTLGETVEEADWLIGADLLLPGVQGKALRSLAEPGSAYDDPVLGKDPQPAHMDDYIKTQADNGGVHINSGIPNRAFYVTATELGGNAWERAGWIWYAALRDARVKETARFLTFARATRRAARTIYGEGSGEVRAVETGWEAVGLDVAG
jgi:Zn-dependent metalloprotease